MRKLHGYVLKSFVSGFFIVLFAITSLYLVIDVSTNLEKFLKADRADVFSFIVSYYLYRLPFLLGKLCPLIALLSAAFTLTFLEKRNELTPIKASGISMKRLLIPLLAAGGLLAALTYALEEWVIPRAAREIYMKNLERSDPHLWNQLIHDREGSLYIYYVAYFPPDARMERVYVSHMDRDMREREFLYARECRFLEKGGGAWVLRDGYRILYDREGFRRGPPENFEERALETGLRPSDMERRAIVDEMPLSRLALAWRKNPSLYTLGVRFHFRAALPAANVLLLLVGLPIVLSGAHRRYFLGALATALMAGAYYGFTFLCLRLGMSGSIPPFVAGWAPPVLFTAISCGVWGLMPT